MPRRTWLTLATVAAGGLLSLSCVCPCLQGLSARRQHTATAPQPTVAISDAAASRFEEKTKAFSDERFDVELTDEEVTSYLALHATPSAPIASPQVAFHPGKVVISGQLTSPVPGHLSLSGTLQVANGRLQFEFQEASLGGLPVPRALLASVSDTTSQMIVDAGADIVIERVELLEGRIRISGHRLGD